MAIEPTVARQFTLNAMPQLIDKIEKRIDSELTNFYFEDIFRFTLQPQENRLEVVKAIGERYAAYWKVRWDEFNNELLFLPLT